MSTIYGPETGALVWTVPILLFVTVIALWANGETKKRMANLCFYSFGTTLVNAVAGVLLGLAILAIDGSFVAAIGAALIGSVGWATATTGSIA